MSFYVQELTQLLDQLVRAALLALLAVEGPVTRDAEKCLIGRGLTPENARPSLNQTLNRLRENLEEGCLAADGDRLGVTGGDRVDTWELEEAVGAGRLEHRLGPWGGVEACLASTFVLELPREGCLDLCQDVLSSGVDRLGTALNHLAFDPGEGLGHAVRRDP